MFMDEQILSSGATPESQQIAPSEKMLSQSEVNALIAREKQAALARGRQEAEREYQQRSEQANMQAQQQQQEAPRAPSQADTDSIYQQVQERFNREMQERQFQTEMSNLADAYHAKMKTGRETYDDFDEVTKDFDPGAFPQLLWLVSGMENAGDIIYDLSKNPHKLAAIDSLAAKSVPMAQAELRKLSQSISHNSNAKNEYEQNPTAAPLNPLQPSRVSGSNGKMTVNDLRNQPWLRG
jgi:hypothetical protein